MPQVGGKHFPYTEAGYKAADAAKKRMGHKDYRKGGLFYKTGGLEKGAKGAKISQLATATRNLASTQKPNPAHARWLKRKASVRNQFPNTPDGNRRLRQAIGPKPSKTK